MARYALVDDQDAILRYERSDRVDLNAGTRTGYRWLPVVVVTNDTSTGADIVTDPVVVTVDASQVTHTFTVRDMTAQEIDDSKTALADGIAREIAVAVRGLANGLRDAEDRISALEGDTGTIGDGVNPMRPDLTLDQIRNWVKGQL